MNGDEETLRPTADLDVELMFDRATGMKYRVGDQFAGHQQRIVEPLVISQ